ncbi:peptidase T, partial [Vibrio cholerae]|nr:peptidase T [Vibrio cholerae]
MNIVDRFIAYTEINTTTNRENGAAGIMPSSPNQLVLAKKLGAELEALGLIDVVVRDTAIVTATLPSNVAYPLPTVAFF